MNFKSLFLILVLMFSIGAAFASQMPVEEPMSGNKVTITGIITDADYTSGLSGATVTVWTGGSEPCNIFTATTCPGGVNKISATTDANGAYSLCLGVETGADSDCTLVMNFTKPGYLGTINQQLTITWPTYSYTVDKAMQNSVQGNFGYPGGSNVNTGNAAIDGISRTVTAGRAYFPVTTSGSKTMTYTDPSGIHNSYSLTQTVNPNVRNTFSFTIRKHANLTTNSFGINYATINRGETFSVGAYIHNLDTLTATANSASATVSFSGSCASVGTATQNLGNIAGGNQQSATWTATASTTALGTCTVTITPAGTDADSGTAAYAYAGSGTITISNAYTVVINSPSGTYTRGDSVTIEAAVRNANNQPVTGATVTATLPDSTTMTLTDVGSGIYRTTYVIPWNAPATWNLVVSASKNGNSGTATRPITINTATLNVVISPIGSIYNRGESVTITATVTYPGGSPVTTGSVTATSPTGNTITLVNQGSGVWSATYTIACGDPVGTWTITISANDGYGNTRTVSTSTTISNVYTVDIASPAAGTSFYKGENVTITATVIDVHGNYVTGATVTATRPTTGTINLAQSGNQYTAVYTTLLTDPSGNWNVVVSGSRSCNSGTDTHTVTLIHPIDPFDPANMQVHLAINGTEANFNGVYPVVTNATAWKDFAEGTLTLYLNGTPIVGLTDIKTLNAGTWNYTVVFPGTLHYLPGQITRIVTIAMATPTCNLTITPASPIVYGTNTTATCTCTNPETTARMWRNGVDVTSESGASLRLNAGTYNYVCNTSQTTNYNAATDSETYVVQQADPTDPSNLLMGLTINGIEANFSGTYPVSTNAHGWINPIITDGTLSFTRDTASGAITNPEITTLPAGTHVYTFSLTGSVNYMDRTITRAVAIARATSTCTLTVTPASPITYGTSTTATCSCTNPEASAVLWRNGNDVTATENGIAVALPGGYHDYVCNVSQTQNYTAASQALNGYHVLKLNPIFPVQLIHLAINGIEANFNGVYPVVTNATAWSDLTEGDLTLLRNGNVVSNPEITTLAAGTWNYTLIFNNSNNYEDATITRMVTIAKATSTCSLVVTPASPTSYTVPITATCTCTNPEASAVLWRNGNDVTATENGVATFLTVGSHNYVCNTSETQNYTGAGMGTTQVVIDDIAPIVTITSPAGGSLWGPSVFILANTSEPTTCVYSTNSTYGYAGNMTPAAGVNNYSATMNTVASEEITITVTCTDAAGNVGSDSVSNIVLDLSAPVVTIYEPSGPLYAGTVPLIFSPSETSNCAVQEDVGAAFGVVGIITGATNYTGSLIYTTSGSKTMTVQCTDSLGNVGSASRTFEVDVTPPMIILVSNTAIRPGDPVKFNITDANGVSDAWYTGTYSGIVYNYAPDLYHINDTAAWSGNVTVSVSANDTLGNTATQIYVWNGTGYEPVDNVTIIVDTVPPTVVINAPVAGWYSKNVVINATATDDIGVSGVYYSWNANATFPTWYAMAFDGTNWIATSNTRTEVADGNHTLTVVAWDNASWNGTANVSDIAIDNTGPLIVMLSPLPNQDVARDSVLPIIANITDAGVGMTDGERCTVYLDGSLVEYINYSSATGQCAGAITIPSSIGVFVTKNLDLTVNDSLDNQNISTTGVRIVVGGGGGGGGGIINNTNASSGTEMAALKMTIDPTAVSLLNTQPFTFTVTIENIGRQAIGGIMLSTYDLPVSDYSVSPSTMSLEPGEIKTMTLVITPASKDTGVYAVTFTGGSAIVYDMKTIMLTVTNSSTLVQPPVGPGTGPGTGTAGGITGFFIDLFYKDGKLVWSNLMLLLIVIAVLLALFLGRRKIGGLAAGMRKKPKASEPELREEEYFE